MWIFKHYLHNYKLLLLSSFQANAESFVWNEQETSTSKLEKAQSPEELKYQEIKSELEITAASKWVVGSNEKILREGLLAKWDPQDPEYMQLAQKVQNLQSEYKDILNQEQDLNQELLLLSWSVQEKVDMVTESEINRMKTISNAEFLAAPDSERLQYISKNHIDSEKIASWEVADVEFTFTFDGQYNQELYLETTAGQVLPNEVWEVIVDGEAFSRTSVEGEFFNQDWKRLTIHEGTQVNISQLRTADELQNFINIHNDNLSKYPDAMNQTIALEAMNRWIDPDFAILAYGEKMSELPKGQQKIYLEQEMTQFDRIAWIEKISKNLVEWKCPIEIWIIVLRMNHQDSWQDKAKLYWYNENQISDTLWRLDNYNTFDFENIQPGVQWMLDFLAKAEWTNDNYNALFSKANQSEIAFTEMTLRQVLAYQDKFVKDWSPSSAIGRYQFMRYTIRDMSERYDISLDEKFTPEFQDNLAILKLNERWLKQFQEDGDIWKFQNKLSAEWASLPKDNSGLSYYHWDGLNHALVPHDALVKQIKAIWQMS